jgi:hypothetical protein
MQEAKISLSSIKYLFEEVIELYLDYILDNLKVKSFSII